MMSTDSIEPHDDHRLFSIHKISNEYSPRKTFLNIWNIPKKELLETRETGLEDFMLTSSTAKKKQESIVNRRKFVCLSICFHRLDSTN